MKSFVPETKSQFIKPLGLLLEAPGQRQLLTAKKFIYNCNVPKELLIFDIFKLQFSDNAIMERHTATRNRSGGTIVY